MPSKLLDVPFFAQNDNSPWYSDGAHGNTQCNPTSHTMLLAYLLKDFQSKSKANGFGEPEDYLKSKLEIDGCGRGDHDCFSRSLEKHFGIVSEWRTDLNRQHIIDSLNAGVPIVLGVHYRASGHILIATGYDNSGVLINDPYGERASSANAYSIINPGYGDQTGKNDRYSWGLIQKVWSSGCDGWGRIVKSVNGKSTGL